MPPFVSHSKQISNGIVFVVKENVRIACISAGTVSPGTLAFVFVSVDPAVKQTGTQSICIFLT